MKYLSFLTAAVLLLPGSGWSAPIPAELRGFLLSRGQQALVEKYESIPTATPDEVAQIFAQSKMKLAGAGWNGAAFKDPEGHLLKLSHAIFGAPGVTRNWSAFLNLPMIKSLILPVHERIDFAEVAARRPTEKEILGTLLWAAYFSDATTYLPDLVSSDGAAYRRRFVPGTPLNEVLSAQSPVFDMKRIWQQVVAFQNAGERMLQDGGVMVDLLSSGNFIVSGTPEDPILELVDHEFVAPSPETKQFYAARGITLPDSPLVSQFEVIYWPLMPDHIVQSNNWKLTFDQALEYLSVRYGLRSRQEAIARLAATPEWQYSMYPHAANYSHIKQAKAQLRNECAKLLLPPDKK